MKLQRRSGSCEMTEDEAKVDALIFHIMSRIDMEDERLNELSDTEKVIYCSERLSAQININGFSNFFDYGIALMYDPILSALDTLEAKGLASALRAAKNLLLGDQPVNEDTLEEAEEKLYPEDWDGEDDPELKVQIERLTSDEAEDDFHAKFKAYVLQNFDAGGYELSSP